jgi:YD repeat-containing protein
LNQPVLEVPHKLRSTARVALRDHVAIVVVDVAGRAGGDKTIVRLITIGRALVTSKTLPNGVAATYTYDGLDRLTRLKDAKGNTRSLSVFNILPMLRS